MTNSLVGSYPATSQ